MFGFAKQSGGDVDVSSKEGSGASFTLYLPEVQAPTRPSEHPVSPPALAAMGEASILVVEDNLEVGRFCVQVLEDLGYRSALVGNAEEALVVLEEQPDAFDIVFSDIVMPGMGGIELANRLHRDRPDLPVVLASGYSHALAEDSAHGFTLIQKPYSAEQLSNVLHASLRR